MVMGEQDLIARYFAPLAQGLPGAFRLGDDTALLASTSGPGHAVTCDTLVAGVHFPENELPSNAAFKALSVNVSDLAAKGAQASAYLLSLALPVRPDAAWFQHPERGFCSGLEAAQKLYGCHLAGGDMVRTPGPLTITITAIGTLPGGRFVRRSGAQEGDVVVVSGRIGAAALGYRLWQAGEVSGEADRDLRARYHRPEARQALAPAIAAHASAAMDVSDGLAGDFAKLCAASNLGGEIRAGQVPLPPADAALLELLLSWGDDYEILATIPPARLPAFRAAAARASTAVTAIGKMTAPGAGVHILSPAGRPMTFACPSHDHFLVE